MPYWSKREVNDIFRPNSTITCSYCGKTDGMHDGLVTYNFRDGQVFLHPLCATALSVELVQDVEEWSKEK